MGPTFIQVNNGMSLKELENEFNRMGFNDDKSKWKISNINQEHELCTSYPRFLILPANISDEDLDSVARFRAFGRIPTVVWRSRKNGCFIVRCSQPGIGLFWARNKQDEDLIQAYVDIREHHGDSLFKFLIVDARSYSAAWANRAKGGGIECVEYYQACNIQFMNLANIHSIRKSFQFLHTVCEAYSEQSNNWLTFLENSRWLHYISAILSSALLVVETIDVDRKSTLIHCSDGWDRTPQIVALAEIMLDPFYRTIDGFCILIRREWLDFGHKFADRCGNSPLNDDMNERCPVFLQWLDCVHQLLKQYPNEFEFNFAFLSKLNRHTFSNIFSTFSYNSTQERLNNKVEQKSFSLWSYLDARRSKFRNDKYNKNSIEILRPSCKVEDMIFWKEVYLPFHNDQCSPNVPLFTRFDNRKLYDSIEKQL